jgi:hypothetical protein
MMGKMTPPMLEPLVATPYAIPLLLLNHPATLLIAREVSEAVLAIGPFTTYKAEKYMQRQWRYTPLARA